MQHRWSFARDKANRTLPHISEQDEVGVQVVQAVQAVQQIDNNVVRMAVARGGGGCYIIVISYLVFSFIQRSLMVSQVPRNKYSIIQRLHHRISRGYIFAWPGCYSLSSSNLLFPRGD